MAHASPSSALTTGPAAAALLGAGLGLLAVALSHVFSERSETCQQAMQTLGNVWIPGAQRIGPYAGKETVGLLVWLVSWASLHILLKKRQISVVAAGVVTLVLVGTATTLLWPPVTHLFVQ